MMMIQMITMIQMMTMIMAMVRLKRQRVAPGSEGREDVKEGKGVTRLALPQASANVLCFLGLFSW